MKTPQEALAYRINVDEGLLAQAAQELMKMHLGFQENRGPLPPSRRNLLLKIIEDLQGPDVA